MRRVPDLAKMKNKFNMKRTVRNINFGVRGRSAERRNWPGVPVRDTFAVMFSGTVHVPRGGNYNFQTRSDDGAKFYIDGKLVVNNDRLHAMRNEEGSAKLSKGPHSIRVDFFERCRHAGIVLRCAPAASGSSSRSPPSPPPVPAAPSRASRCRAPSTAARRSASAAPCACAAPPSTSSRAAARAAAASSATASGSAAGRSSQSRWSTPARESSR